MADRKRSNLEFQVGDMVLLKLQPYTQTSIISRPFPKLSFKYFGPYKIIERIGAVAYKLELPADSKIHNVFHVSQLKPFLADYTPVYADLPAMTDIDAAVAVPEQIIDRRMTKRGNASIPHVLVKWSRLLEASSTWEDYHVLRARFSSATTWGQAGPSTGGAITLASSSS